MHPEQLSLWDDKTVETFYVGPQGDKVSQEFREWFRAYRDYEWGDPRYLMTSSEREDFVEYYSLMQTKEEKHYERARQLSTRIATTPFRPRSSQEMRSDQWAQANDEWRAAIRESDIRKKKAELLDIERTCVWCGAVVEGDLDAHEEQCTS